MRGFIPRQNFYKVKGENIDLADGSESIRIRNKVFNGNLALEQVAIRLRDCSYIDIEYCVFKNYKTKTGNGGRAIRALGSVGNRETIRHLNIKHNTFIRNTESIEFLHCDIENVTVDKNRCREISGYLLDSVEGQWRGQFFQFGNVGLLAGATKSAKISRNKVHIINGESHDLFSFLNCDGGAGLEIEIEYNLIKGEDTATFPYNNFGGAGFVLGDDGGNHLKMKYCSCVNMMAFGIQLVYESPGTSNISVEHCVLYNLSRNTIKGKTGTGFQISAFATDIVVKNNSVWWKNLDDVESHSFLDPNGNSWTETKRLEYVEKNRFGSASVLAKANNILPSDLM